MNLLFFSDFIKALKVLLLILLFAAVFNSLYHSEKVSFNPILHQHFFKNQNWLIFTVLMYAMCNISENTNNNKTIKFLGKIHKI